MEYFNQESVSLYLKIAMLLVFVMPFLYMADASAYARCRVSGVYDEFLDIPGICESLDLTDISKEAKQGISTSSIPEKVIYASVHSFLRSFLLNRIHNQQLYLLYLSILRYKGLIDDLIPSPFFTPLWFWKLTLQGSKPFCFENEKQIFFSFSLSILRTSIIIS
jgi:hypothetical protein